MVLFFLDWMADNNRSLNVLIIKTVEFNDKQTAGEKGGENWKQTDQKATFLCKTLLWLLLLVILFGFGISCWLIMRQLDPRMEQLFEISVLKQYGIMGLGKSTWFC